MKQLIALLFMMIGTAYAQQPVRTATVQSVNTYQPPTFADADRLAKLQAAFPIVEKLYRERAEKFHYPGMAFGIVLDGKLVYSGGMGYTDVAKKTPATPKSLFKIASMTKSPDGNGHPETSR
jgi:CubicO group peptidase (beta-lactamase class C family)